MLFRINNSYKNINVILEAEDKQGALYLGDYTAAINQSLLKQRGIKTVLTVASGLNIKYPPGSDIMHKIYNILDIESCNIMRIWGDTFEQISEGLKRGSVLVHCAAGVSRSAATVIAYLMKSRQMGFYEALQFVRQKRSVICPNAGFQRQLRLYEREIGGKGVEGAKPVSQIKVLQQNVQLQQQKAKQAEISSQKKSILSSPIKSSMKSPLKQQMKSPLKQTNQFRLTKN